MPKNDLIGGALWEQYSNTVAERMNHPRNLGEIDKDEASSMNAELVVAEHGAESCGDAVRLYWAVERATETIVAARFKSFGCGTAIAASDMMAELCVGKTIEDALKITNLDVEKALRDNPDTPAVPPQKMHCSVMAYDVIKAAAAQWKGVDKKSLESEDIVCECARVSLSTLKNVIRINNLKDIKDVIQYTKAGAFCKSCLRPGGHETRRWYIEDILAETQREMRKDASVLNNISFDELSVFKKFKAIEQVLSAEIRPALQQDGGDIEVENFYVEKDVPTVIILYQGACLGCGDAAEGTLSFIESVLRQKLHPKFRVKIGQESQGSF